MHPVARHRLACIAVAGAAPAWLGRAFYRTGGPFGNLRNATRQSAGSDGFAAGFLNLAWDIIRPDIMKAFDAFWHFDTRSFHLLNDALMILLPNMANAATMRDYRPISLIHIVGKLFSLGQADQH
jgi:hypothetical protein